jgi:hypothetical protein
VVAGGATLPGYSHVAQFISESYAIGTPYGPVLRFAGYLPAGLLIALFAWTAMRVLRVKTWGKLGFGTLGVFYGLGTALTAFFPCDAGCGDADPTVSQLIHNLSGFLTYLTTPGALMMIGAALRKRGSVRELGTLALVCGIVAMIGFVTFVGVADTGYAGLVQRVIECSILVWIGVCAARLRTYT